MKTPLSILTFLFALSFFDGFFGVGLSEDVYIISGFLMIISIVWLWYEELRKPSIFD